MNRLEFLRECAILISSAQLYGKAPKGESVWSIFDPDFTGVLNFANNIFATVRSSAVRHIFGLTPDQSRHNGSPGLVGECEHAVGFSAINDTDQVMRAVMHNFEVSARTNFE